MKLAIFNGSPRQKKSNSGILIQQFLKGYSHISGEEVTPIYLGKTNQFSEQLAAFQGADIVLIFFPLYTDSMPGIVKLFLERIYSNQMEGEKKIGFIVQSGFPEAHHSTFIARYLKKYAQRSGFEYLGTVIKGGVEGIQIQPPSMTRKLFKTFAQLGEYFAQYEEFDPNLVEKLQRPYKLSILRRWLFQILSITGLANFYWNMNLKKNNAYKKRFDRPFEQ